MASSSHKQQQRLPNMYGPPSAPPPTPSAHLPSTPSNPSSAEVTDFLSCLIHRLPPTLSFPPRCQPSTTADLPSISFPHGDTSNPSFLEDVLSTCTTSSFFQLTGHPVSKQVALSAESEMVSAFDLSHEKKRTYFPWNWPFGYVNDVEDEESYDTGEFFLLDESSLSYAESESTELELSSLRDLSRSLEKVGWEVIGWLFDAMRVESPVEKGRTEVCSLAWVSKDSTGGAGCSNMTGTSYSGLYYPFVVGLRYQVRSRKYSLMTDSGPVVVAPQVDSILVTIGDVAQLWSNGRLKKVRGRPIPCPGTEEGRDNGSGDDVALTLLMTLPMETTVSPLPRKTAVHADTGSEDDREEFDSFAFEDYAWRVYPDRRISYKDPLDR
ncbi:hypothetical protein MLD38_009736 [Melastoma candidum]|uniref:Uncharacterized protein n=1 Tax=Melastoma candidum TaxID=119954 RepID=A0ACB9S2U3_9MYRT|nr:hypothetical protein MLD38_009736 [Melastoma candidum]